MVFSRTARNQAFDAEFDQDELADARKWYSSFSEGDLPKGQTSYARSSGPGGQHVNKYEFSKVLRERPSADLPTGLRPRR